MSKETPRPWSVEDRRNAPLKNVRIISGSEQICDLWHVHQRDYQGSFKGDHKAADEFDSIGIANADLIVRAVNAHDALVEVLKEANDLLFGLAEAETNAVLQLGDFYSNRIEDITTKIATALKLAESTTASLPSIKAASK